MGGCEVIEDQAFSFRCGRDYDVYDATRASKALKRSPRNYPQRCLERANVERKTLVEFAAHCGQKQR